jgi:hypothetical protein
MLHNEERRRRAKNNDHGRNDHRGKMATSSYRVNEKLAIPRRLAEFLFAMADEQPGRPIKLPVVAKVVLILPSLPAIDGKDVKRLKHAINRARDILLDEYKCGLDNIPGEGLRATANSNDFVKGQISQVARRAAAGFKRLDRNRAAVKMSEVTDPEARARMQRITSVCKTLTSADVLEKLRLPSASEDADGKPSKPST